MCLGGGGQPDTPDPKPLPPPPPIPAAPRPLPLPSIRPSQQAEEDGVRLRVGRRKTGPKKEKKATLKSLRTTLNTPIATPAQGMNSPSNSGTS